MDLNKLENNTILELREFAKEIGIKSVTRYKKAELIQLIQEKLKEMAEMQQREWLEKKRKQEGLQQEEVQAHDREQETAQPGQPVEQERKPARRGRPRKKDVQAGQQEEAKGKAPEQLQEIEQKSVQQDLPDDTQSKEETGDKKPESPELYDEEGVGLQDETEDESVREDRRKNVDGLDSDKEDYERQVAYDRKYYNTSNPAVPILLNTCECGDAKGDLEVLPDGY